MQLHAGSDLSSSSITIPWVIKARHDDLDLEVHGCGCGCGGCGCGCGGCGCDSCGCDSCGCDSCGCDSCGCDDAADDDDSAANEALAEAISDAAAVAAAEAAAQTAAEAAAQAGVVAEDAEDDDDSAANQALAEAISEEAAMTAATAAAQSEMAADDWNHNPTYIGMPPPVDNSLANMPGMTFSNASLGLDPGNTGTFYHPRVEEDWLTTGLRGTGEPVGGGIPGALNAIQQGVTIGGAVVQEITNALTGDNPTDPNPED